MRILKRSLRYITRKKEKTIALFILLLVIGVFILSTLAVENAAMTAQIDLRQSLGGSFLLNVKYSEENPYYCEETVEDSNGFTDVLMYSTKQISNELVNEISSLSEIKYCEAKTEGLCQLMDIQLKSGTIPIEDEFKNYQKIVAVYSTETCSEFVNGHMKLVEGRNIVHDDDHVIMISDTIAELNNLKVGDKIFILDGNNKKIQVELIGIFKPDTIEKIGESVTTYDRIENRIYSDLSTLIDVENNTFSTGYDQLFITVNDPEQLESAIEMIRKMKAYDNKAFEINMSDETNQETLDVLKKIEIITKAFLVLSIIVSIVVLTLVLTMWSRGRIHETGIYLGCGISRREIIFQYLLEALVIGSIAFTLACIPGKTIAYKMGEYIASTENKEDDSDSMVATLDDSYDGGSSTDMVQSKGLETKVGGIEILALYIIGTFIIILSVGNSSMYVFRLKPREILSKMS